MRIFSWFRKKAFGDELVNFGQLPSEMHGWRVTVTLRQIREQPPYLLFKWELGGENEVHTSLACTPEVYAKMETIIQESRKRIGN